MCVSGVRISVRVDNTIAFAKPPGLIPQWSLSHSTSSFIRSWKRSPFIILLANAMTTVIIFLGANGVCSLTFAISHPSIPLFYQVLFSLGMMRFIFGCSKFSWARKRGGQ
jgi:hypothetical protein